MKIDSAIIAIQFLIVFFIIMAFFTKSDNPRFDNSKEFLFMAVVTFIVMILYLIF